MTKTTLDLIRQEGEGQRIEFKVGKSHLDRELVAFANAGGGTLFLGIEDDGKIRGISQSNKLLSEIQSIARNCDPSIRIETRKHAEDVVEIVVPEGTDKPYRCKEGFFLRIGPNSQKMRRNEIRKMIVESGHVHYDELFSDRFNFPTDLDTRKVEQFAELSGVQRRFRPKNLLASLELICERAGQTKVTNAGVLFFAKSPQRFIRESHLTCARYAGKDRTDIVDRQDCVGDPISQIEEALNFVDRNTAKEEVVSTRARHQTIREYPPQAMREAVTNAVMHRDYYYDLSHTYIHIYRNRLEVENPGGLSTGLSLDELGERSVRRNRMIADLLYRAGYVEKIGSGIQRMKNALQENNNPPFEITASNFFVIRFFPRIRSKKDINLSVRQSLLLRIISAAGRVSSSRAAQELRVSGDTALRELKVLMALNLIRKNGTGKSTEYSISGGD